MFLSITLFYFLSLKNKVAISKTPYFIITKIKQGDGNKNTLFKKSGVLKIWCDLATLKFFYQPDITIYTPIESPCRVDKKYAVLKNIYSDFRPKKS